MFKCFSSPLPLFIMGFVSSNYIFSVLSCCDVRYDFLLKTMFGSFSLPFVLQRVCLMWCLCILTYMHVYWCPTRFPCHRMLVSFNSNYNTTSSRTCRLSIVISPIEECQFQQGSYWTTCIYLVVVVKSSHRTFYNRHYDLQFVNRWGECLCYI